MASNDVIQDGKIKDFKRIKFYSDHLTECIKILKKDIPLKGYFAWSLLDNFEWAYGYSKRFGIVYVDFNNLKRIPKLSWNEFRKHLKWKKNEIFQKIECLYFFFRMPILSAEIACFSIKLTKSYLGGKYDQ